MGGGFYSHSTYDILTITCGDQYPIKFPLEELEPTFHEIHLIQKESTE